MSTDPDYQPVIVIGAARSGTKFLRDILAAAPNAAKVPYDVNYVWRYRNEARADDEFVASDCTPAIRTFIRRTLPSLARFSAARHTAVVEKTVGNSLRIPFVEAVFPDARYVVLLRDGRAVTESAMRMWEAKPQWASLFDKLKALPLRNYRYVLWFAVNYVKGLFSGRGGGQVWGPRYKGIESDATSSSLAFVCARQWARSVENTLEGLRAVPAERQRIIRYEDLVADESHLRDLVDWLGWKDAESVIGAYRRTVARGLDRKWQKSLNAEQQQAMYAAAGTTLAELGYVD